MDGSVSTRECGMPQVTCIQSVCQSWRFGCIWILEALKDTHTLSFAPKVSFLGDFRCRHGTLGAGTYFNSCCTITIIDAISQIKDVRKRCNFETCLDFRIILCP